MADRRDRRGRRQRCRNPSHRKLKRPRGITDRADFISSMPDEILHHILSFTRIAVAIRTSVLSRRWRHVWCEMPCLAIDESLMWAGGMNQTLASYTASKITSFKLYMRLDYNLQTPSLMDRLVEFPISRNVEKLSVTILDYRVNEQTYGFPDFFYLSSSLKQLSVSLSYYDMIPRCTVSWKYLRNLSLTECKLPQEAIDNILSGCPILESLTLNACRFLERLDLRKSLSLRRLEIYHSHPRPYLDPSGPVEIVAPHIHFLKLYGSTQFMLVDVSSLTEAHLYIWINIYLDSTAHCFQTLALELLAKLHNVESLTLGATLLQVLSLAEHRGVPFPEFKVQTLIIRTEFAQSIPGIARLLQHSPGLKKLTVYMLHGYNIMSMNVDQYWGSKYKVFAPSDDSYSVLGCNVATSKVLAWFMELVLRNAKTLETMVVWLGSRYFDDAQWFDEQLQIVATLSHNNNVSIALKRNNYSWAY